MDVEHEWRKIDRLTQGGASCLSPDDLCYFYMDRFRGGWDRSKANQLISNLKKPLSKKGRSEYYYKGLAITEFAHDLAVRLSKYKGAREQAILIAMPPSQCRDNVDYDDRIAQVVEVASDQAGIDWCDPFDMVADEAPSHLGGTRSPDALMRRIVLNGDTVRLRDKSVFMLVDDVLTSGAHYVACRRILDRAYLGRRILGLFWAKQLPEEYDYELSSF